MRLGATLIDACLSGTIVGACHFLHSTVTYALNVSERLGRTSSKEQYAFMYR